MIARLGKIVLEIEAWRLPAIVCAPLLTRPDIYILQQERVPRSIQSSLLPNT